MNISGLIGFIASAGVFILAILDTTASKKVFLNEHAIIIVCGGTLAATLLSFPIKTVITMLKVFSKRIFSKDRHHKEDVIREIISLAEGLRNDPNFLHDNLESIEDPFLREGVSFIVDGGLSDEEMDDILIKRSEYLTARYTEEAQYFKSIGKFPPAFGLMATTLGMISLLQSIGGKDSFSLIGPSMGIALVATFYGVALANLVFLPVGENLQKLATDNSDVRDVIFDGIIRLRKRDHPFVVKEHLISYLLPSERKSFE